MISFDCSEWRQCNTRMQREGCTFDDVTYQAVRAREWAQFVSYETTERYREAIDSLHHLCDNIEPGTNAIDTQVDK